MSTERARNPRSPDYIFWGVLLCFVAGFVWLVDAAATKVPPGYNAEQTKALLGCKGLAQAIAAYDQHPSSANVKPLRNLDELLHPPWGGPPMIRNGREDLIDPWGKPYQMEFRQDGEGKEYPLILTRAPDGTPISQFGVGRNSRVDE